MRAQPLGCQTLFQSAGGLFYRPTLCAKTLSQKTPAAGPIGRLNVLPNLSRFAFRLELRWTPGAAIQRPVAALLSTT